MPIGQHLGSQSKPLVNTLLFTGRGDDVWSTPPDEPDMALHIRWDSPRVVCTRYGIFQVREPPNLGDQP
ncbi:hypothetical protein IMZ48_20150 [Candidatus Bathyarchaeota archaeon]|nr:hypothetical protein [Candidatus Bathyarchaeota archaeon]